MKNIVTNLQPIGRALMLPIAVLPAAALLLRFGQPDLLNIPWLADAGGAVFPPNLWILFAIGVAAVFTADVGTAAVAGFVGYVVFNKVMQDVGVLIYGKDEALDAAALGGIMMGLVAATIYERYHTIRLPEWLAFFGGRRFVPLVTAFAAVVIGLVFGFAWHYPQAWLHDLANGLTTAGAGGAAIHGFLNRLLIPVGLHHVINSVVWFQFGDLTNFFSSQGKEGGLFMTGFFPIMMFALPAAGLAIYQEASPGRRRIIGGVMLSGALTSFVTGVTEPLEFAFLFVAWPLFLIHAVLTGTSLALVNALGVKDGFGFSAGAIDYVLNFTTATRPLVLIPVGLAYAVVYYLLFRCAIRRFDLATPGRERDDANTEVEAGESTQRA